MCGAYKRISGRVGRYERDVMSDWVMGSGDMRKAKKGVWLYATPLCTVGTVDSQVGVITADLRTSGVDSAFHFGYRVELGLMLI